MAYIDVVDSEDPPDPTLRELFDDARERFTLVPEVLAALAVRPEVAKAQAALRRSLLDDASSLGKRQADLIALAVSAINGCAYCATAHAGMLIARQDLSAEEVAITLKDWRALDLERSDRAMLEFAEKLTFHPASIGESDIEALREAGLDDMNIYDVVLLTAYRNFINRVNDGLGVSTDKLRDRFGDELADDVAGAL